MTIFTSLTPLQQEQAAFLFADEIFGTDPHDYDYEINGATVTGRTFIHTQTEENRRKPRVTVKMSVMEVPASYVTPDMLRRIDQAYESIARRVVARLIQSQTVEA